MFAKGLGGIEQAFVDYTQALLIQGYEVVCVVNKGAKILDKLERVIASEKELAYRAKQSHEIKTHNNSEIATPIQVKANALLSSTGNDENNNFKIIEISQLGKWDLWAKWKLNKLLAEIKPGAVIAHGNRPSSLFRFACKKNKIPLISVAHNYKIKPLLRSDYIFSITDDLKNYIGGSRFPLNKVFVIPNMLKFSRQSSVVDCQFSSVPTIGVMARFVKKKGVDVFLKACGALKDKGYKFNAVIGGTGEEQFALQELRDNLKLNDIVKFTGWVKDKNEFYNSIDIFCLPSHHEPFGIVILEAFFHKKPIVTTDSEGPSEICENRKDCIMVERGHAGKLAIALSELLDSPTLMNSIAEEGYKKLNNKYTLEKVAVELNKAVEVVIGLDEAE